MPQEEAIRRIMPHSLEAEQSVIGSMIMDADAVIAAAEMLREDDFYSRQYGILFRTILEMSQKNVDIDPVTLQESLKEKNLPPEVYSAEMIMNLIAAVPTSANIRSYADIVVRKSLLRKLIHAGEDIANACYTESEETDVIMDQAEKKIFEISESRGSSDFVPVRQVVLNAMERIEAASRVKGTVTGLPTGFLDLDRQTAGFQRSDMILIAARPSMGKTALALNIAEHLVMHEDKCIAIFSLEMSKEQLMNRLLSMESRVDSQKIRTGTLSDQESTDLIEAAGALGESRLILDDTPAITVAELRSKCRKYKMEFGLEMVLIDYLQLMTGAGKRAGESRQQEISDISRSLKAVARELDVPIVALSQLSRAVEQRPNKRPMLSDLRESGAIEQDADLVMFIYRDEYYNPDTDDKNQAEIIIAKHRNGPVGTVKLGWTPALTRFTNLETRPDFQK